MSAREPMGMAMETAMDAPPESRREKVSCGFCGQALFGQVAYCPYCGHPWDSASAAAAARQTLPRRADAPAVARQESVPPPPPMRWKLPRKTLVIAATAIAFVIAVGKLAVRTADDTAAPRNAKPAPATATAVVTARVAPKRGASASAPPAPRAEPAMPRVEMGAPPAPRRSLCSPANEAAGLCNPQ